MVSGLGYRVVQAIWAIWAIVDLLTVLGGMLTVTVVEIGPLRQDRKDEPVTQLWALST